MIFIPIFINIILILLIFYLVRNKNEYFYASPWRAIFKYELPQSNDFYSQNFSTSLQGL